MQYKNNYCNPLTCDNISLKEKWMEKNCINLSDNNSNQNQIKKIFSQQKFKDRVLITKTNQKIKMRKRINFQMLKQCQNHVQKDMDGNDNLQKQLYNASYELINDLLTDIKRPFKNICIHGYHANQVIDYLAIHYQHNIKGFYNANQQVSSNNLSSTINQKPKLTIIDYLDLVESPFTSNKYVDDNFQIFITKLENSESFIAQEEQFDLIISSLELNHCNNEEKLLEKYLRTLKPDGALIGCAMVEGTLSELQWSYLMAENERHGGLSPKVISFPSLGQLGNLLTQSHYHLATVLNRDYHLQLQSPLQVIKAIQLLGENLHLKGRRKGVYKELLVAMYAMYQNQFSFGGQVVKNLHSFSKNYQGQNKEVSTKNENDNAFENNVLATVVLSPFVGWKYSPTQPKPLRRGKQEGSIDFVDQLRKYDPDLQHFTITEEGEQQKLMSPQQSQEPHSKDNQSS